MPYIYQSDVWCDSCGLAIKQDITRRGEAPEWPVEETTYDSNEYPKEANEDEEADYPQHCGSGRDCLEAEVLPGGQKVGCLLSTCLTVDGVNWLQEELKGVAPGENELLDFYRDKFSDYLRETND